MKKFISFLLIVCMMTLFVPSSVFADGDYMNNVFVINYSNGPEEVNSIDESGSGNGWSYDAKTATLTFDGIEANTFRMFYVNRPFKIILKDKTVNRFTFAFMAESDGGVTIDGNGTLKLEFPEYEGWGRSIDLRGKVTFEGGRVEGENCILLINGSSTQVINNGAEIYVDVVSDTTPAPNKLVVNAGKIIADSKLSQKSAACDFSNEVNTINATAMGGEKLGWTFDEEQYRYFLSADGKTHATYAEFKPVDYFTKTGVIVSPWARDGVNKAIDLDLIHELIDLYSADYEEKEAKGYTLNITRGAFATVAVRLYEKLLGKELEWDNRSVPFKDVDISDHYSHEIFKAYQAGLMSGVSADTFDSRGFLTREQVAAIMYRIYDKLGKTPSGKAEVFSDDKSISDWAKASVYAMAEKGIMAGTGNNCFSPKENTQIQQALAMAVRIYEDLK